MRPLARFALLILALLAVACGKGSTAPTTGTLQVTITGLGATPAVVTVSGPAGYSHAISSTTTLSDLTPGAYAINATAVPVNGSTYAPSPAASSVTITASTTPVTATVTYAPATGGIALTVSGLPGGTNASVTITGPASFSHVSTASETLTNLTPGSYTLTSASVPNGSNFYDPVPLTQSAVVTASTTPVTAVVAYGVSGGFNLFIDGMYISQAAQNYAGTVPLVKDRDGFLRIFVRANHVNTARPKVRVRWYSSGTLVRTDTVTALATNVPTTIDQGVLTSSWNLHVPGSLIQPNLSVLADVDPDNTITETTKTDNSFPLSGVPEALSVHTENAFNVTLVPVRTKLDGRTGNVNAGNIESYVGFLQRIHPLPGHLATLHAMYTTVDSTDSLQSADGNGMWTKVLSEIAALRSAESAPASQYYYGVVDPAYSGGVAGEGYIKGTAAIGWDRQIYDQILAHEVGHNWGRNHSPGCGAQGVDPSYPNLGGFIDDYGVDIAGDTIFVPTIYYDIMSYCHPEWTSVFTYTGVMQYREANPDIVAAASAVVAPEPVLLVWGRMRGNELVLEPAFEISARAQLPEGSGDYTIEGLDDRGAPLFSYQFAGTEIADAPTPARGFAFAIPVSQFDVTRLSALRLAGRGREIKLGGGAAVAAMRASAVPSTGLKANAIAGGRTQVTWDAASYPMALIRDAVTGQVLSFARGGSVDVKAAGPVTVTLSDGVRSVEVQK